MSKQFESCFICEQAPCVCNKSKTRDKQPPVAPVRESKKSRFKVSPESVTRSYAPLDKVEVEPVNHFQVVEHIKSEDELILNQAICNLESILHPIELAKYKSTLRPDLPSTIGRNLKDWRERHGLL